MDAIPGRIELDIDLLLIPGNADGVWDQFVTIMGRLGYPHLCYRPRAIAASPQEAPTADAECRSNFPAVVLDRLRGRPALLDASPWGNWARGQRGALPFSWIQTAEAAPYLTPDGMGFGQLLAQHGLLAGHVVSLLGVSSRMTGTVALSTGPGTDQRHADALWRQMGTDITRLCDIMHLRIGALPQMTGRSVLTPRQREVVEWAACGKTVAEIAAILGVESTTVEKHLRLAREALGARTTAQAILHAHQRNQIFVTPMGKSATG
ncbi:hypothetical protein FNJ84_09890 [Paracoccus sp. M683]|uniref:helix-turn-helix transcriptional regulator n=1 Tax=Paracoccus sp. M683 TaxID=2594268 RepID=UPI00117DA5F7|nr:LuxR C-terminal-related transcriptional regulator [Paracoccus sp. M683]TRW97784.1 hypothetical protein FNJ84_09890 [Paracoccus sp. M683]